MPDSAMFRILEEHLTASSCKGRDTIFPYAKDTHQQGPSWPCIWKQRTFLGDLVHATGGHLLRLKKFEAQMARFTTSIGQSFSADDISVICRRPRLMLSHLWSCKRGDGAIPSRYPQLKALKNSMDVDRKEMELLSMGSPRTNSSSDGEEQNDEYEQLAIVVASQDTIASSQEVARSEKSRSDDEVLLDAILARHASANSSASSGAQHASAAHSSNGSSAVLQTTEIDALVASCAGTAPTQLEYRALKKALKRPAASAMVADEEKETTC